MTFSILIKMKKTQKLHKKMVRFRLKVTWFYPFSYFKKDIFEFFNYNFGRVKNLMKNVFNANFFSCNSAK